MRALATAGVLVGLLGGVAHAGGDDQKMPEARRLAARAQAHFDLGEYKDAIRDFRDAYRLVPSPGFLYNLGQAYRLEGDCVSATTMYENYLRLAPRSRYRTMVQHHLANLHACVEERTQVDAAIASTMPAHPGRTNKRVGLAVGGAGLAVAGFGTWLALSTDDPAEGMGPMQKPGDEDAPEPMMPPAPDDHRMLAAGLIGGGVVAIAAGATLYYLGWREERLSSTAFSVMPLRGGGAAASIGWSF